jgi:protein-S-isoprenylcysteine O-methyltransferase Ste14
MDYLKTALLIYWVLLLGLAFVLPTYRIYKLTGVNPYRLGNSTSAHDFVGGLFRLILLSTMMLVLVYVFAAPLYTYTVPIPWLEQPLFRGTGLLFLTASLFWIIVAQVQMGKSWRIGIDAENKTVLVQHGLFALSRNPIFLGMRVSLLGFFLVMPNALTLLTFVLGDVLMQIQVRLEEEHLARIHSATYEDYLVRVRRWL